MTGEECRVATVVGGVIGVRKEGLGSHASGLEPKSSAFTNSATFAYWKYTLKMLDGIELAL